MNEKTRPVFSASRSARTAGALAAKGCEKAVALSKWKDNIRKNWPAIRISDVQISQKPGGSVLLGDTLEVTAPIAPDYVTVHACVGEASPSSLMPFPARASCRCCWRISRLRDRGAGAW